MQWRFQEKYNRICLTDPSLLKGSENVSNDGRPESGQSAMINGHSYPIREQTAVFQVKKNILFYMLNFFENSREINVNFQEH